MSRGLSAGGVVSPCTWPKGYRVTTRSVGLRVVLRQTAYCMAHATVIVVTDPMII